MSDARRAAFGAFLRSRREKLTPKAIGLPSGPRRRAVGLRREEVAELAGIGIDWYIRLEQGRTVNPSAATIEALARALRLSRAERAHLAGLARHGDRKPFVRETIPQHLRRMVDALNQPAYITGRRWDVLAWNDAADEIFGFGHLADEDRNTLRLAFLNPAGRALFGAGWSEEAKRMMAQFRATYDLWAGDPAFEALLEQLRRGSRDFATWWKAHDVRGGSAGHKSLQHPRKGRLELRYASFQAIDDPALKLTIYMSASDN